MARSSKSAPNPNDVFREWLHTSKETAYSLAKATGIAESTFWRLSQGDFMEPTKRVRRAIEEHSDGAVPASIWVT